MVRSSIVSALLLSLAVSGPIQAQEATRSLTLDEAIQIALEKNPGLAAARDRVDETHRTSQGVFTNYLPQVKTYGNYLANNNPQGILLPRGSLGYFSELGGPFPRTDRNVPQGGTDIYFQVTTVAQPLTQYFKIREARGAMRADEAAAGAGLRKAEGDVVLGVLQAYAGLLIAEHGRDLAQKRVEVAQRRSVDVEATVRSGNVLDVAERDAKIKLLQARQTLLQREDDVDDLNYKLTDVLGLPAGTRVEVTPPSPPEVTREPLDHYVELALRNNPEILQAEALVDKATHGRAAARTAYIPDIGLLGAHLYQSSFPFLPKNTVGFGISGSWTIFDFGARHRTVQARDAQLRQAKRNLDLVEGRIRGEVETAYRKLGRAEDMVDLASQALSLRSEAARLQVVQVNAGYAVAAKEMEATSDRMGAELDLLKAQLGHRIAIAELAKATGTLAADHEGS